MSGSDRSSPSVAFASRETPLLARLPKAQSKFPKLLVGRRLCCPAAILQRCQIVNSTQCTRKAVSKRIQFYQCFIVQGYSAATNYARIISTVIVCSAQDFDIAKMRSSNCPLAQLLNGLHEVIIILHIQHSHGPPLCNANGSLACSKTRKIKGIPQSYEIQLLP